MPELAAPFSLTWKDVIPTAFYSQLGLLLLALLFYDGELGVGLSPLTPWGISATEISLWIFNCHICVWG